MTKKVTVLGSTGSIGTQSLDVIRAQEYSVFGLAAHSNVELLLRQVQEFHPHCIAVVDDAAADRAARELHGMPGAPVLLRGKEVLKNWQLWTARTSCSTRWWALPGLPRRCPPSKAGGMWRWPTRRALSPEVPS